jgi:hypothetical protein
MTLLVPDTAFLESHILTVLRAQGFTPIRTSGREWHLRFDDYPWPDLRVVNISQLAIVLNARMKEIEHAL